MAKLSSQEAVSTLHTIIPLALDRAVVVAAAEEEVPAEALVEVALEEVDPEEVLEVALVEAVVDHHLALKYH